MEGLILILTFVVIAAISLAVAVGAGLLVDKLPHIHDLLSVLTFFGILVLLLPVSWVIAVRLSELRKRAKR